MRQGFILVLLSTVTIHIVTAIPNHHDYEVANNQLTVRADKPSGRFWATGNTPEGSPESSRSGVPVPVPGSSYTAHDMFPSASRSGEAPIHGPDIPGQANFKGDTRTGELVWKGSDDSPNGWTEDAQMDCTRDCHALMKNDPLYNQIKETLYTHGDKPTVMTTATKGTHLEMSSSLNGGDDSPTPYQVQAGLDAAKVTVPVEHSERCGEIECAKIWAAANKDNPDVLRDIRYHSTKLDHRTGEPVSEKPCKTCRAFIDKTGGSWITKRGASGCICPEPPHLAPSHPVPSHPAPSNPAPLNLAPSPLESNGGVIPKPALKSKRIAPQYGYHYEERRNTAY